MNSEGCESVAFNSRNCAQLYLKNGNPGRAFSHYLIVIKLKPEWKCELKEEFASALCSWGRYLQDKDRLKDMFNCYEQAIEVFPENEIILNNLGAHLLSLGKLKEAAHYFRSSYSLNKNYLQSYRNLQNISNLVVERWHFSMLNDEHRNEAYREAIIKKIQRGYISVLDIGTGSGILSLFAKEGGAQRIYSCDDSPVMIDIAKQVIKHNHGKKIKLINKYSTDLTIPEDLRSKVSLVVTETFDTGLLGEHVLQTLIHAHEQLLQPKGIILPMSATVYCMGVQCNEIARNYFDNEFENLKLSVQNCYDVENLKQLKYLPLTNQLAILDINFNDINDLKNCLSGLKDSKVILEVSTSGRLDAIISWFQLQLDEDIKINTSPESKQESCWNQAVFPLENCKTVIPGLTLDFQVTCKDGKFNIYEENLKSLEITFDKTLKIAHNFQVSSEMIRFLNNKTYRNMLDDVYSDLKPKLLKKKKISVLDCSPYPHLGLSIVKDFEDATLTCVVKTEGDKEFVNYLNKNLNILLDLDEIIDNTEKFDVVVLDLVEKTGELNEKMFDNIQGIRDRLHTSGTIIPERMTVIGQPGSCKWLKTVSEVTNSEVTCGYHIADFINVYKVDNHLDFKLDVINHKPFGKPIELVQFDFTEDTILENINNLLEFTPIESGVVHTVPYWFSWMVSPGNVFVTTDVNSHVNQAAFLLSDRNCSKDVKVAFIVLFNKGILRLTWESAES